MPIPATNSTTNTRSPATNEATTGTKIAVLFSSGTLLSLSVVLALGVKGILLGIRAKVCSIDDDDDNIPVIGIIHGRRVM